MVDVLDALYDAEITQNQRLTELKHRRFLNEKNHLQAILLSIVNNLFRSRSCQADFAVPFLESRFFIFFFKLSKFSDLQNLKPSIIFLKNFLIIKRQ